jgi:hypothetical protein
MSVLIAKLEQRWLENSPPLPTSPTKGSVQSWVSMYWINHSCQGREQNHIVHQCPQKLNLTFRKTVHETVIRVKRECKLDNISTSLAPERAAFEPEPIAMPASAQIRVGESLMPFLTIATIALPILPMRLGAGDYS